MSPKIRSATTLLLLSLLVACAATQQYVRSTAAEDAAAAAERWASLDHDLDGVANAKDKCLNSHPNYAVVADGCPMPHPDGPSIVSFDTNSVELRADTKVILTNIAAIVLRHNIRFNI